MERAADRGVCGAIRFGNGQFISMARRARRANAAFLRGRERGGTRTPAAKRLVHPPPPRVVANRARSSEGLNAQFNCTLDDPNKRAEAARDPSPPHPRAQALHFKQAESAALTRSTEPSPRQAGETKTPFRSQCAVSLTSPLSGSCVALLHTHSLSHPLTPSGRQRTLAVRCGPLWSN